MRNGADNWWRYAEIDLRSAQLLLEEKIYTQACFHAQQAVEKALKAVIAARGETPPRMHRVSALAELAGLSFDDLADLFKSLDFVYLPTRYPDALPGTFPDGEPSEGLARECVEGAVEILRRVKDFLRRNHGLQDPPAG